ncbi:MAG: stage II sporulation protein D [Thermacetogeniaceae bacterium]
MKRGYRGYKLLGLFVFLFSLALIGLPALLVRGCMWEGPPQARQQGPLVRLQVKPGQVITLPLEEYLIGVVAAEMPAEFHPEALKAQAVAARTYTMLRMSTKSGDNKHPEADLCVDPEHCQAWISVSEMRRKWGVFSFSCYYGKIAAAVRDTEGEVAVYQGQLIDPVYHASCGGLGTEDAAEVWNSDVPYLKGVACTWDPQPQQQPVAVAFTYQDLFQHLGLPDKAIPTGTGLGGLIRILDRTPRGRVKDLQVGTQTFKATALRKSLNLRSTDFTVKPVGNKVVFEARGYGHAVGMCQWGAQGLALQGKNYKEILTYYYQGVQIVQHTPVSSS